MDDKQLALLLTAMSDQTAATNRMADAMTGILLHLDPKQAAKFAAPGYMRPLAAYANFDWNSIGANVIATDKWGATEVEYNGASFRRYRSNDDDPKGVDIRFRRVVSGTPEGKDMIWATLVKFFDRKAKDPPRPLRGELADTITDAIKNAPIEGASRVISQPQKQIAVAVAPTTAIKGPEAPKKPTVQDAARDLQAWIAPRKQSLVVNQCRQCNEKAVAWALTAKLPQDFIDSHTSPSTENSGPAMLAHAEILLTAIVTGKVPQTA